MGRLRTAIGVGGLRLAGVRGIRLGGMGMILGRRLLGRMLRAGRLNGGNLRLGFYVDGLFENIFALMAAVSPRLDDHVVVIGGIDRDMGEALVLRHAVPPALCVSMLCMPLIIKDWPTGPGT